MAQIIGNAERAQRYREMQHENVKRQPNMAQYVLGNVGGLISDPQKQFKTTMRQFAKNYVPSEEDEAKFRLAMQGSVMGDYDPMIDRTRNIFGAGATVFHGSPHKFLKFDSAHIGKGEGAQAYGHGLYLADKADTAGFYQANLSKKGHLPPQPRQFTNLETGESFGMSGGKYMKGSGVEVSKAEFSKAFQAAQNAWDNPKFAGHLYKVDLPDTEIAKMLDWDAPLSEQPESVRKAIKNLTGEGGIHSDLRQKLKQVEAGFDDLRKRRIYDDSHQWKAIETEASKYRQELYKLTGDPYGRVLEKNTLPDSMTGADLYRELQRKTGNQKEASRFMETAGIPGIKYYDGGSRAPRFDPDLDISQLGDGYQLTGKHNSNQFFKTKKEAIAELEKRYPSTRNYVVFPGSEKHLNILDINGKPVKLKPYQVSPTSKEWAAFGIDEIDRAAFGFARDDIKILSPNKLSIKWFDDLENAKTKLKTSGMTEHEWAKSVDLSEPIDVIYEGGKFKIDDGHHRYLAAKILGKDLPVNLEIKDKPFRALVDRAKAVGDDVHPEMLKAARGK